MNDLRAGGHKLVSVDVFDTILLRGRESERRRMAWVALGIAEALRLQGFSRKPAQVWRARLDAQAIAYSAMRVTGDRGDVKLADIHRLQALALGVPERLLPATLEAELRADSATLRANRALVARLQRRRRDGARVVAVSDTYYSAKDLERLLRTHRAEAAVDAVYASADFGATKKGGRLSPVGRRRRRRRDERHPACRRRPPRRCRDGDGEGAERALVAAVAAGSLGPQSRCGLAARVPRPGGVGIAVSDDRQRSAPRSSAP